MIPLRVDQTGITGMFRVERKFVPSAPRFEDPGDPADDAGTSIFAALQELGLKLESAKGPVEPWFIDRVDKAPGKWSTQ